MRTFSAFLLAAGLVGTDGSAHAQAPKLAGWSGVVTYSDVDMFTDTVAEACKINRTRYSKRTTGSIDFVKGAATFALRSNLLDNREEISTCGGMAVDSILRSGNAARTGVIDAAVGFSTDKSYAIRFQFPELKGTGRSIYTYGREPSRNFKTNDDYIVDFSPDGVSCFPDEKQPAKLKVATKGDEWEQSCEVDNWDRPRVLIGRYVSESSGTRKIEVSWDLRRK